MTIHPNGTRIKSFGINPDVPNCVGRIETSFVHNGNVFYMVKLDYEYQGYIDSEKSKSVKEKLSYISCIIVCADGAHLA